MTKIKHNLDRVYFVNEMKGLTDHFKCNMSVDDMADYYNKFYNLECSEFTKLCDYIKEKQLSKFPTPSKFNKLLGDYKNESFSKLDKELFNIEIKKMMSFYGGDITDQETIPYYKELKCYDNQMFLDIIQFVYSNFVPSQISKRPYPSHFKQFCRIMYQYKKYKPFPKVIEDQKEVSNNYKTIQSWIRSGCKGEFKL